MSGMSGMKKFRNMISEMHLFICCTMIACCIFFNFYQFFTNSVQTLELYVRKCYLSRLEDMLLIKVAMNCLQMFELSSDSLDNFSLLQNTLLVYYMGAPTGTMPEQKLL